MKQTAVSKTMEERREQALATARSLPPPKEKDEQWRHTQIEKIDVNQLESSEKSEIKHSNLSDELQTKGVIVCSLQEAMEKHSKLVQDHYDSITDHKDKIQQLNSAHWKSGLFVYVPSNVDAGTLTLNIESTAPACTRNLIVVEQSSTLSLLEESKGSQHLSSCVTEVIVKEDAHLHYVHLSSAEPEQVSFSNIIGTLESNASANWFSALRGGKINRLKIDTHFKGEGATSTNNGLFLGVKKEHLDLTTNAHHHVPHTTNDMNTRGIMKDQSSSIYRGMIKIDHPAQQTNSFLSNHTLKLSEKSIAHSIPALEIDTNDVKASHGATIGDIDEEQLFYLMSRGLEQNQAESLIIEGFFQPLIEKIDNKDIKEKIQNMVRA